VSLVVPLHRELKRGPLNGILRDAGLSRDELREQLRLRDHADHMSPRPKCMQICMIAHILSKICETSYNLRDHAYEP
jgi:hypothetical protein